jgi:hypothetical protein
MLHHTAASAQGDDDSNRDFEEAVERNDPGGV